VKPNERTRIRIALRDALLVRKGEVIDEALADERSRNLTTIIEILIGEFAEEDERGAVPQTEQGERT